MRPSHSIVTEDRALADAEAACRTGRMDGRVMTPEDRLTPEEEERFQRVMAKLAYFDAHPDESHTRLGWALKGVTTTQWLVIFGALTILALIMQSCGAAS